MRAALPRARTVNYDTTQKDDISIGALPATFQDIAYGNGMYVGVSTNRVVISPSQDTYVYIFAHVSSDGVAWEEYNLGSFLAPSLYSSTNPEPFGPAYPCNVQFNSSYGKFILTCRNRLFTSSDGIAWNSQDINIPSNSNTIITDICTLNDRTVLAGTVVNAFPYTGNTFVYTTASDPSIGSWNLTLNQGPTVHPKIRYISGLGKYVMSTQDHSRPDVASVGPFPSSYIGAKLWLSTDATTWSRVDFPENLFEGFTSSQSRATNLAQYPTWNKIHGFAYGNGKLIAGFGASWNGTAPQRYLQSTDGGSSWSLLPVFIDGIDFGGRSSSTGGITLYTPRDVPFLKHSGFGDMIFNPTNGRFIVSDGKQAVHVSTDAINWTSNFGGLSPNPVNEPSVVNTPLTYDTAKIRENLPIKKYTHVRRDMWSDDGITWVADHVSSQTSGYTSLSWQIGGNFCYNTNNGNVVGVIEGSRLVYGSDTSNLKLSSSVYTTANVGQFFTVIVSINGSAPQNYTYWQQYGIRRILDIAYSPTHNRYVVASQYGLLYSSDLVTWQHPVANSDILTSFVEWDGTRFVAGGQDYRKQNHLWTSGDGVTWSEGPNAPANNSITAPVVLGPGTLLCRQGTPERLLRLVGGTLTQLTIPAPSVPSVNAGRSYFTYNPDTNKVLLIAAGPNTSINSTSISYTANTSTPGGIYESSDNGSSWSLICSHDSLASQLQSLIKQPHALAANSYSIHYSKSQKLFLLYNAVSETSLGSIPPETPYGRPILSSENGVTWNIFPGPAEYDKKRRITSSTGANNTMGGNIIVPIKGTDTSVMFETSLTYKHIRTI